MTISVTIKMNYYSPKASKRTNRQCKKGEICMNKENIIKIYLTNGGSEERFIEGDEIPDEAFDFNREIVKVIIPEGIKKIGDRAFYGCENLEEVIIPNGMISIGLEAFRVCKKLKYADLPNTIESLGAKMFCHCVSLTRMNIPENKKLTTIPEGFCSRCSALTAIIIPRNIISINKGAFRSTGIKTAIFSDTLTVVEESAFKRSSLTKIMFYNDKCNIQKIGAEAFSNTPLIEVKNADKNGCVFLKNILLSVYNTDSNFTVECDMVAPGAFRPTPSEQEVTIVGCRVFCPTSLENLGPKLHIAGTETTFYEDCFSYDKFSELEIDVKKIKFKKDVINCCNIESLFIWADEIVGREIADKTTIRELTIKKPTKISNPRELFEGAIVESFSYAGKDSTSYMIPDYEFLVELLTQL